MSSSRTHHLSVTLHLLTCPPCPNEYPFVQIISFFTVHDLDATEIIVLLTFSTSTAINLWTLQSTLLSFIFLQVPVEVMAPKSKQWEIDENPFLPPPVNLDWIPLANKDYLILEPKCKLNFTDLHSWFRDTFLDQSDEIGIWESNLPLYLFPQIHHFLEFALKCQTHYLPNHRAIVSSSGDTLFTITPEAIDQMMQIPRSKSFSPFTIEILTEMYQKLSFP
jgi:hypothetical protein